MSLTNASERFTITPAQRVLLLALTEIMQSKGIQPRIEWPFDPGKMQAALEGGHDWAVWEMVPSVRNVPTSKWDAEFIRAVAKMYRVIDASMEAHGLAPWNPPFPLPAFIGFDRNAEPELQSMLMFLTCGTRELARMRQCNRGADWTTAASPRREVYEAMLAEYEVSAGEGSDQLSIERLKAIGAAGQAVSDSLAGVA